MATCCKLFAGLIFVLAAAAVMQAEENAVPVTEARIAELVKQLDDDDFALREAAVNELVEIGPAAAEQVAQAAQGDSLEAATRAFAILDKWLAGDQPEQAAAREQLGKLAQGAEENSTTRRAKALLTKQQPTAVQPTASIVRGFFPGVPVAGLRLGVARVEMRAMAAVAGGAVGRSISVSIGDGKKTINVAEGDFKAQIIEDAKEGIKITTTTKDKEGKENKTEYAAKDLKELKEKQPEGHKVYEKYAGAMNQLKIKMEVGGAAPAILGVRAEERKVLEHALKVQDAANRRALELKARIEKQRADLKPAEDKPKPAPTKPDNDPFD